MIPDNAVRYLVDQLPDRRQVVFLQPCSSEVSVEDHIAQTPVYPGGHMHPIGDMLNGNLVHRQPGPKLPPHLSADLSVLLANRVSKSAATQGKGGHVKAIRLGRIHSQAEELISGEIQRGKV